MNKYLFQILLNILFANCFTTATKQPNIVLIVVDDMGWGDLSLHGSQQSRTPNIDVLAANGIQLNSYYVSPLCSPSRAALMTGVHPIHSGVLNAFANSAPEGLPLKYKLLPEYLKDVGYETHAVGKWHLGFHKRQYLPTSRGFDTHFGYYTGAEDYYNRHSFDEKTNATGVDFRHNERPVPIERYEGMYATEMYTERAVDIICKHREPLFLYLALQSPHAANPDEPLQAPEKYRRRFKHVADTNRRTYLAMMAALDDSVGAVVSALQKENILNETIIIFTTDNGAPIPSMAGDVDLLGSNWPLRGGKASFFEGGVRGMAFIWSTLLEKRYLSNHLMHVQDWLPTIYRAVGADPRQLGAIDGIDMWDTLKTNGVGPRKTLVLNAKTLRTGRYKLMNVSFDTTDYWYLPPGETIADSVDTIDYNTSQVFKVLKEIKYDFKDVKKFVIQCNSTDVDSVCDLSANPCLFDIISDPCEYDNLFARMPTLVNTMFVQLSAETAGAVPVLDARSDPDANPLLHNNYWSVWQ